MEGVVGRGSFCPRLHSRIVDSLGMAGQAHAEWAVGGALLLVSPRPFLVMSLIVIG